MSIYQKEAALRSFNTFGINVHCSEFLVLTDQKDIPSFFEPGHFNPSKVLILGGGSNILFTGDYNGLVIHPAFKGVEVLQTEGDSVYVRVGAGENWDQFVEHAVRRGWGGLENLSYIPGTVGGAPVQNIGAYGVEVKDLIESVEGYHLEDREFQTWSCEQCVFAYRNSIFKQQLADRFLITAVTFKLSTRHHHLVTEYGDFLSELEHFERIHIRGMRETVIHIRKQKLPDPSLLGNAGSFFKNPVISIATWSSLLDTYPHMPFHEASEGGYKIPAAWLIDQCNWKGYRYGDAGVHAQQPLVLVNYGAASGRDILDLAKAIQKSVYQAFGIELEQEVRIV